MVEQLFGSKTRVKLLRLFMGNPNRSFYVREITRKVEEQINSVRRELANLLSIGLITSDSTNNKLYYEVSQKYEHYDALRSMFAGQKMKQPAKTTKAVEESPVDAKAAQPEVKTEEIAETKPDKKQVTESAEAEQWIKTGNVLGIAYSGIFTRDDSAGVDILVIGDVNHTAVDGVIAQLEKEKNTELRFAVMERTEWDYRRQINDKFWLQFDSAKKQVVLDKDNIFSKK